MKKKKVHIHKVIHVTNMEKLKQELGISSVSFKGETEMKEHGHVGCKHYQNGYCKKHNIIVAKHGRMEKCSSWEALENQNHI